ncbi:putative quinone oxidoreductase [Halotydeus destructor]|nr:putative quinone oxidoreductase [Halotydeus destructor]
MFSKLQVARLSSDFRTAVEVVRVPLKDPEPDQVRIKVKYCGANASDINASAGRYLNDGQVPFDIGLEAMGLVDKVGQEVTNLDIGQPVAFLGVSRGYAEYIYAKPAELGQLPSLDPRFMGCLIGGLTAAIALDHSARIKRGDKVLVTAAAGGTGQLCVQWAKKKGCHVIGTCSDQIKRDYLLSIGCDTVINYMADDLDETLSRDYPDGVDVIWETLGGEKCEMLMKHLAHFGRLIIIGGTTGYKTIGLPEATINPAAVLFKSQTISGFILNHHLDKFADYLPQLIQGVMDGSLTVKLDHGQLAKGGQLAGLKSIVRAVEHIFSRKSVGKVLVEL